MDAVNRGYQVVVPRDAVSGVPQSYADSVVDYTLAVLATITTVADLTQAWALHDRSTPGSAGASGEPR